MDSNKCHRAWMNTHSTGAAYTVFHFHRINFILFFKLCVCFIKSQINGVNLNSLLCQNYADRTLKKKLKFTIFGENYGNNFSHTGDWTIVFYI